MCMNIYIFYRYKVKPLLCLMLTKAILNVLIMLVINSKTRSSQKKSYSSYSNERKKTKKIV